MKKALRFLLTLGLAAGLAGCSAPAQEPDEGLELFSCQLVEDEAGPHYLILGLADGVDAAQAADLVIPGESSKRQIPVTELASAAFQGNGQLRSVTLPPSVTKLGEDTFSDCPALERLHFPGRDDLAGLSPYPAGQLGGRWLQLALEDGVALRRSLAQEGAEYTSSGSQLADENIISLFETPDRASVQQAGTGQDWTQRFFQDMAPFYLEGDLKTIDGYLWENELSFVMEN